MAHNKSSLNLSPLLYIRGVLYIVIGLIMFVFANTYSFTSGIIIGVFALLAGGCQLIFSFANLRDLKNNVWGVLHGVTDLAFGGAMFVYSQGTIGGLVDVLGMWAVMYAFLQSVQAMYAFMAARGPGWVSGTSVVHFLNVLTAGGLAFMLLQYPEGFYESLQYAGIFPIILGVLIIILVREMQIRAAHIA